VEEYQEPVEVSTSDVWVNEFEQTLSSTSKLWTDEFSKMNDVNQQSKVGPYGK